jgi:hypothetical protein
MFKRKTGVLARSSVVNPALISGGIAPVIGSAIIAWVISANARGKGAGSIISFLHRFDGAIVGRFC